jgi:Uma2 family endonuclease
MEAADSESPSAITDDRSLTHQADALKRLEAWLSLPEKDRAELLGGRIVYRAMASPEHGGAAGEVYSQIRGLQGPPGGEGGGWWISQDVDLYLGGQGVRPDVVGWRADRHPRMPRKVNVGSRHLGVIVTPPDWVCEVLSISTRSRDEQDGDKWHAYQEAGVGYYWLVDLIRGQLTVYRHTEQDYEPIDIAGRESSKVLPPFSSIEFSARRLFQVVSWLKAGDDPPR